MSEVKAQCNRDGSITILDGKTVKAPREASFELLRIVAMLMIVTVHYLSKGGVLADMTRQEAFSGADYAAWFVEALCMGCVDLYILISGYHGCMSQKFKVSKTLKLWGITILYSVGITVVCGLIGVLQIGGASVSLGDLSIYQWLNVVFPVTTEEYWFITAYIIASLFIPFINAGVSKLTKKQFQWILILLVIILSVAKSVLPISVPYDKCGYDTVWFLCLYVMGAYIRLHGFPLIGKKWLSLACYFGFAALSFGASMLVRMVYLANGSLVTYLERNPFYQLNFIGMLGAAVSLFCFFASIHIKGQVVSKIILQISGCTLGVYLIHEQLYFKYMWSSWCGASGVAGTWAFIPNMLLTVLAVFAGCCVIDFIRGSVAKAIFRKR